MASFPKIDSPCPLRWKEMPSAGRDFCTLCKRQVHNLDAMSLDERRAFLASCSGEVCVAYTVPRKPLRAAAAGLGLAAALSLTPALAEPPAAMSPVAQQSLLPGEPKADCDTPPEEEEFLPIVYLGGVRNPAAAQLELETADNDLPELPVIDDDALLPAAEFVAPPQDAAKPR
ncbi:hypothetical protein [Tahibacter harae]|uniref:Secreted protein n=1 Tax=Tahibacter harae TaxID=2963937 RepID=A0ABT1QL95_9GAMM|nr:hypothetical protein [Tahibacter harae]MCQ4163301.1 hypothetical protein [Tahibacter harae]